MMMMMMVEMVKMVKMVDSDLWSSEKQKVMFHSLRTNLGAHLKIIIITSLFVFWLSVCQQIQKGKTGQSSILCLECKQVIIIGNQTCWNNDISISNSTFIF